MTFWIDVEVIYTEHESINRLSVSGHLVIPMLVSSISYGELSHYILDQTGERRAAIFCHDALMHLHMFSCCLFCPRLILTFLMHLFHVHFSVSRTYVKRNLAMRRVRGVGRRILSSLSSPKCCHCLGPSRASWTRLQSSGWPSATCTCAPLPARGTRRGAPYWRGTATATKVSKRERSCEIFEPRTLIAMNYFKNDEA